MKIIRVTGCHDCEPYASEIKTCVHPKRMRYGAAIFNITDYIKNKALPDNCPLEDVVQIITKARVEEVHGSAK